MSAVLRHDVPSDEPDSLAAAAAITDAPRRGDAASATPARGRIRDRESKKRDDYVTVGLSVEEKSEVRAAARKRKISLARLMAEATFADIRGEASVPAVRAANSRAVDELASARRDLAKVGGNLNQIAHRLNSGGTLHSADHTVLDAVRNAVAEVRKAVAEVDDAAHRAANRPAARKAKRNATQAEGTAAGVSEIGGAR